MKTLLCTVLPVLLGSLLFREAASRPALKEVFKDAFVMGVAVNEAIVSGRDPGARELVLRHFDSITA
ncbi:MAG TPA: hypothetical protein VNK41_08630, partial [Vicinamibacterales bacterium]|nr:hypothetical protein [Vicinamibacterales bacterium]